MKYSEILEELNVIRKKNGYSYPSLFWTDIDLATCVACSMGESFSGNPENEEEFEIICSFVSYVWDKIDKGYTQLLADIVIDLYQDQGWGYRDEYNVEDYGDYFGEQLELSRTLTLEQMKEADYRVAEMVVNIFYERYYD